MSKPPAFQFYPDDFLGGTADMTPVEVGAYIRLLCHQWNRGSIPVQPDRLTLIAGCEVSPHVLSKFPMDESGAMKNERLEKERAKQSEYREKQRLKGIASGEARRTTVEPRLNHGSVPVGTQVEPKTNSPSPSPSPISGTVSVSKVSKGQPKDLLECTFYAIERGMPESDGEWFWDKGLASGWRNNGEVIKDWRATFRTWQHSKFLPSQKTPGANGIVAHQAPLFAQRQAIEKQIEKHPANEHFIGFQRDRVTQAQRDHYKKLKDRLSEIERQEAGV